jgi:outer membrane biosynthesis protein TonB
VHFRSPQPFPRALRATLLAVLTACGGAGVRPPLQEASSSTSERAVPDTFAVSGLRGTLSTHEIDGALKPKLARLLGCIQQRRSELEVIAGSLSLAFHVATDGSVVTVHPTESTLGDRATERCMLAIAAATRFPPPHGGEADFSWPLAVDPDSEVREPVALPTDRAAAVVSKEGEPLRATCGGGSVVVTMYVQPDGSVATAGVAAPDGATDAELDCVAEGVRRWKLPSPGSYLGKLSVPLP